MLKYKTKLEKSKKMQQKKTQDLAWGDGERARKSLLEVIIFIIKGYKYQKINWKNVSCFLYQTNPRDYKVKQ